MLIVSNFKVIEGSTCKIENTIEFLGRKHMLKILNVLYSNPHPLRFSDFSKVLGINSKTLADRLKELTEVGVIRRVSFDEIPPRVEYSLTSVGDDLGKLFNVIDKFDLKHVQAEKTPNVTVN